MTANLTTEGKTMAQQQSLPAENSARADDIARALRQLRKWGFRITRDPFPADIDKGDDELIALADHARETQARRAACAFLGLGESLEEISRQDVVVIARALIQNAVELPGLPSGPRTFVFDPRLTEALEPVFEALLSNRDQK